MKKELLICSAVRTPIGSFMGELSGLSAPELASQTIKAVLQRCALDPTKVDQVVLGQVLTAGAGQAPARQAMRFAGIPDKTPAVTVNKVCGSGLQALIFAAQSLLLDEAECVLAGGMENMSQAPFLMDKARAGYRLGHGQLLDSIVKDGLWDVYNDFHMGNAAELCVKKFEFSRAAQDEFTANSYAKAQEAEKKGSFSAEKITVEISQRKGQPKMVSADEEPLRFRPEKLSELRPAFDKNGTITAANASSINDGASVLLLTTREFATAHGLKPLARIVTWSGHAQAPEWFTTAPVEAMNKCLARAGWQTKDVDLWEINEAFANVTMAAIQSMALDPEKVNIHGGAVALGHPIGASGARIVTTLVHALETHGKQRGMAGICIGGGEALAMAVERLS